MSILTSWVAKLVIALAVAFIVVLNGVEVLVAHVGGQSDAQNAAYAAAQTWQATHNYIATMQAAKAAIPSTDTIATDGCSSPVDGDGTDWTCTVTRPAHTVLMSDIGFLKKYTVAKETGQGSYQP